MSSEEILKFFNSIDIENEDCNILSKKPSKEIGIGVKILELLCTYHTVTLDEVEQRDVIRFALLYKEELLNIFLEILPQINSYNLEKTCLNERNKLYYMLYNAFKTNFNQQFKVLLSLIPNRIPSGYEHSIGVLERFYKEKKQHKLKYKINLKKEEQKKPIHEVTLQTFDGNLFNAEDKSQLKAKTKVAELACKHFKISFEYTVKCYLKENKPLLELFDYTQFNIKNSFNIDYQESLKPALLADGKLSRLGILYTALLDSIKNYNLSDIGIRGYSNNKKLDIYKTDLISKEDLIYKLEYFQKDPDFLYEKYLKDCVNALFGLSFINLLKDSNACKLSSLIDRSPASNWLYSEKTSVESLKDNFCESTKILATEELKIAISNWPLFKLEELWSLRNKKLSSQYDAALLLSSIRYKKNLDDYLLPPESLLEHDSIKNLAEILPVGIEFSLLKSLGDKQYQQGKRIESVRQTIRDGQAKFRKDLFDYYEGNCLISGNKTPSILEAAHIHPYYDLGSNEIENGLLLRVDLHRLFDSHLLGIEPSTLSIHISRKVDGYKDLIGRTLQSNRKILASRLYLMGRWKCFKNNN